MTKFRDVASGTWSNGVSWEIVRVDVKLKRYGDRWYYYVLYVNRCYMERADDIQSLFYKLKKFLG